MDDISLKLLSIEDLVEEIFSRVDTLALVVLHEKELDDERKACEYFWRGGYYTARGLVECLSEYFAELRRDTTEEEDDILRDG